AGLIVWGFVGSLPVTETVTGLVVDTSAYYEMDPYAKDLQNRKVVQMTGSEDSKEADSEGSHERQSELVGESTQEANSESTHELQTETAADTVLASDGENGEILVFCFVDASKYSGEAIRELGDEVTLKMPDQSTYTGTIEIRGLAPISMEEAKKLLFNNGWVVDQCVTQNYNWWLIIRPTQDISKYAFTLAEVTLLTDEVEPIQFLMK
ncbi:MAG: hypothetical protein ABTB30_14310, partial [Clostridia bacterium]